MVGWYMQPGMHSKSSASMQPLAICSFLAASTDQVGAHALGWYTMRPGMHIMSWVLMQAAASWQLPQTRWGRTRWAGTPCGLACIS